MKDFIFNNLTIKGVAAEDNARLKSNDFFRNVLYPEGLEDCSGDARRFARAMIGKYDKLKGEKESEINFPVGFVFEFGRDYSITKVNGKFEVVKI